MNKSEIIIDFENRLKKLARDEEIILFDVTQPKTEGSAAEKFLKPFTYVPLVPKTWSPVSRGLTGFMLTFCIIFGVGMLMSTRMNHHHVPDSALIIPKDTTDHITQTQTIRTTSTIYDNQKNVSHSQGLKSTISEIGRNER